MHIHFRKKIQHNDTRNNQEQTYVGPNIGHLFKGYNSDYSNKRDPKRGPNCISNRNRDCF